MPNDPFRELLSQFQGNPERILIAKDAEGNEFSQVSGYSIEYVDRDYNGGRTEDVFNEEDLIEDSEEGTIPENFVPVLVLWPV
jgi:hypothetical protein